MTILDRLRSAARAAREIVAATADQAGTVVVTAGPFSATLYPRRTVSQTTTEAPAKCKPGACSRIGVCLVCDTLRTRRP